MNNTIEPPKQYPIFIGGTGRSGTTALSRLLGYHLRLFVLKWETQFIVAPDGLVDLLKKNFQKAALQRFLNKLRGPWFRRTLNAGRPNEYSAGLCDDMPLEEVESAIAFLEAYLETRDLTQSPYPIAGAFVNKLFTPAMQRNGAARWGEKTPRNIFYIDYLWRMFPNMKFIHILRDGRDVVASMLENRFWPVAPSAEFPGTLSLQGTMTFEKAVDYWVEMLRVSRQVAGYVPAENYKEIRLEDLAENPTGTLRDLMHFIGEPFDPNLLKYDLSRAHAGRWKQDFSSDQIAYFHAKAGDMLREIGYEV